MKHIMLAMIFCIPVVRININNIDDIRGVAEQIERELIKQLTPNKPQPLTIRESIDHYVWMNGAL